MTDELDRMLTPKLDGRLSMILGEYNHAGMSDGAIVGVLQTLIQRLRPEEPSECPPPDRVRTAEMLWHRADLFRGLEKWARYLLDSGWDGTDPGGSATTSPIEFLDFLRRCCEMEWQSLSDGQRKLVKMSLDTWRRWEKTDRETRASQLPPPDRDF